MLLQRDILLVLIVKPHQVNVNNSSKRKEKETHLNKQAKPLKPKPYTPQLTTLQT
jgi:hypothetical protein